jgi:hypothetical protein
MGNRQGEFGNCKCLTPGAGVGMDWREIEARLGAAGAADRTKGSASMHEKQGRGRRRPRNGSHLARSEMRRLHTWA